MEAWAGMPRDHTTGRAQLSSNAYNSLAEEVFILSSVRPVMNYFYLTEDIAAVCKVRGDIPRRVGQL